MRIEITFKKFITSPNGLHRLLIILQINDIVFLFSNQTFYLVLILGEGLDIDNLS